MSSRISHALEVPRSLVIKRRGAGEWLVKLPWAPWRFREAQRERQELLSAILTENAVGLFLLDPDDREHLSDAVSIVERPSDESFHWLVVRPGHIIRAATDLHTGNWVLFLLNDIPDQPLPRPYYPETVPNTVLRMLQDLGAYACVRSWEDDIEWTIVEPTSSDDEPAISGGG